MKVYRLTYSKVTLDGQLEDVKCDFSTSLFREICLCLFIIWFIINPLIRDFKIEAL